MKRYVYTLLLLLAGTICSAQEYPVSAIPDSLKENANAVVRYEECRFIQQDLNNGTATYTQVITLLNDKAKSDGSLIIYQDKLTELKSFSGIILDADGTQLKKIGKKDLKEYNYSTNMLSDDKYSVYEFHPRSYPATIKYEYTVVYTKGMPSYPAFFPVSSFDLSVQQAKHIIQVPQNYKLRSHNIKTPPPIKTQTAGSDVYEWSLENFKAIKDEMFAPGLRVLAPMAIIAPSSFCMEGYCGDMDTWRQLGLWLGSLQKDRKALPLELVAKLQSMVKDAPTDYEKVKIVYEYLQKNTRYVSIQLGIGGLQPMSATNVAKIGYGDCKALSNYMMAMLESIGIPSIYTVISTAYTNVFRNFASLTQMDHVILTVPLENDTLWLECTSSLLPFNYAHSKIAGHQALWIVPEGGALCRVPKKETGTPAETSCIRIDLNGNPNATATATEYFRGKSYESKLGFIHAMSHEERVNHLAENLKLPKVKILNFDYTDEATSTPSLSLNYNFEIERFANKSANRLFIPLSVASYGASKSLKKDGRIHNIVIGGDLRYCDSLFVTVPAEYTVEALPKSMNVETEFGTYRLDVAFEDNVLSLIQNLHIKKGNWQPGKWSDFYAFMRDVDKEVNKRAVFKQKE